LTNWRSVNNVTHENVVLVTIVVGTATVVGSTGFLAETVNKNRNCLQFVWRHKRVQQDTLLAVSFCC